MMVNQFVPTTSVEYETLTTVPVWGNPSEVDIHPAHRNEKDGELTDEWYKTLNFYTRDMRLGNISHRYDDILYLEDMLGLTHVLLTMRGGIFTRQAWIALNRVTSTLELSQNRGGFFRKIARTVHTTDETTITDDSGKSGFLGKKKKENGWM